MKKLLAILLALAMLSILIPSVQAHTASARYDVPSGPNGNAQRAIATRLCAEEWDDWDEGIFSDSGDELLFGDPDDNPDDTAGSFVTTGATVANGACRTAWAEDGIKIGVFSAALEAPTDSYTNFVTSVSDDNFDSTYVSVCIYTGGDNICQTDASDPAFADPDGQVDYANTGCGSVAVATNGELGGGPEAGPAAFTYATYVDSSTLEVCLGSSGVVTIVMS